MFTVIARPNYRPPGQNTSTEKRAGARPQSLIRHSGMLLTTTMIRGD